MEPTLKTLVIYLIFLWIPYSRQERFQCQDEPIVVQWHQEESCVHLNSNQNNFLELETDSLQNYTVLELVNSSFTQFGSNHFHAIPPHIEALAIYHGNVTEVYFLSESLRSLSVLDTNLFRFFAAEQENRELKTLEIRSKFMVAVPFSIEYLKGLEKLILRSCNLTTIDMKQLGRLENLIVLDLAENTIITIDIPMKVTLASVRELYIEDNFLHEMNNFPMALPGLRTLSLFGNMWYCDWVTEVRKRIMKAWIMIYGGDGDCENGIYNGGLCCDERPG
ncbi:uncharacterized protein LOC5564886 [Aedes aegypti]|uniref:Uncharacterized protein n=1 Tax=Aedes aegypti TaxID=7159 RepID=A0A1S4F7U5_AEDAE|nr:uncharacterized protein LOC5564886 [Aedes aegypti]